jgi:hypothetical protein
MNDVETHVEQMPSVVRVVGFAGAVDASRMPAHRGAILVDAQGHQVTEHRSDSGTWRFVSTDGLLEEPDDHHNRWTRLPRPWPAEAGHVLVFAGREETAAARDPRTEARSSFVRALAGKTSERFVRLADDLACMYLSREERDQYLDWVAEAARAHVFALVASGPLDALAHAAFWLQRAARADDDLALAVAALLKAGDQRAEVVLRAVLAKHDDETRRRLIEVAAMRIQAAGGQTQSLSGTGLGDSSTRARQDNGVGPAAFMNARLNLRSTPGPSRRAA